MADSIHSFPYKGFPKGSKPQSPPLIVPHGHVAFRLLCHASRIGGIIGRSGSIIKNLQKVTGAKIRIEDAPAESPERVVVVVAPSVLCRRIVLRRPGQENENGGTDYGYGGVEEGIECSKAQEALVKVFERIIDVAAETDGADVGAFVVSCRLIAGPGQVGSVIGKGGKVVAKIRKETGCKIRAFTEKLPACTASSDEIIEIEGNVLAVKKALVAVSRCLQDCPSLDKTRMIGSKSHEVFSHDTLATVPCETLPDLHVDNLLQRISGLSTLPSRSKSYTSGVQSLSAEFGSAPTLDPEPLHQEVTFKILCTNDRVGAVIGKGGGIVRVLQNESGASISCAAPVSECNERLITITATENLGLRFSPAQKAVVLVFFRCVQGTIEKEIYSGTNKSPLGVRLAVPSNQIGCLLGKGGAILSEIGMVTGTGISIIGSSQVPKCASEYDQVVQISGEIMDVRDALYCITSILRDNLLSSTQNSTETFNDTQNTAGTGRNYSQLIDTIIYSRPRDLALGIQSSSSISHSMSQDTFPQSSDQLGLYHSLDCPISSGGTKQIAAGDSSGIYDVGINLRGTNDVSRGMASLKGGVELGSGSKSAVVTNTTVEIRVPENLFGSVYGENGSNLARLKQISGANVTVHEPSPGSGDRMVVISGAPDETQAAQSLLQAFILTGS